MSRRLVLVVDDDPDILEAICDIVEVEGYRVRRARNGVEALVRVQAETPDVILLDLMMPVMDGATFALALRERPGGNAIPVVVITADGKPERASALGAAAFLAKPFDIDDLLGIVASITGGPVGGESAGGPQA